MQYVSFYSISTSQTFKAHVLRFKTIDFYWYNVKFNEIVTAMGDKINWHSLVGEDLFDV